MKIGLLTLSIFFTFSICYSQMSLSASFRNSHEGKEFKQNYYGVNTHWLKDNFEFTIGFEMSGKSMDYSSSKSVSDYSHGPPGYSKSTTDKYDYIADISYVYGGLNTSFNLTFIQTKDFSLFFGLSLKTHFKLSENERNPVTDHKRSYSNSYAGVWSYSNTIFPTSHESFDALLFKKIYGSIGLNLIPRFYFNDFFIQGELSVGFINDKIYEDIKGACSYSYQSSGTCFNYETRLFLGNPIYVSSGFRVGYTF